MASVLPLCETRRPDVASVSRPHERRH
jgi:hypothetical protein